MATMNVTLPGDMIRFVESEVAGGGYGSSSEVVREALLLLQHDKAQEQERLSVLRREISLGIDAETAGRLSPKTATEIAEELLLENAAG